VPVVAASVGGLRDTIRDGETGWSYPVGDAPALAAAIEAALQRREPPQVAEHGYTIAPTASGPPARPAHDGHRPLPRPRLAALQRLAKDRGEQAFQAFVRRSSDDRLERTVGSERGLKLVFGAMAQAYEPDKAHGFAGELQYDLRRADGTVRRWTVRVDPRRATAHPGRATAPALTLKMTVADFLRMAAQELDAGKALLTARLDLEGDFSLAQRLGEMFGQPTAL
jgi:putative sterol carrier protein